MMKNWKKIAILGGVLVVFLVAFIVLSGTQKKQTPQSASATPWGQVTPTPSASVDEVKLVDIPKDQITKITLKREGQDIVLTQAERDVEKLVDNGDGTSKKTTEKAKVWETTGFSVDSTAVDDMAASADSATTKRLIDESPKDVTIYGLDKALATTFASGDGKQVTLEIGDKTPTGDSYYVRKSGSTAVYTLDSYTGDTLRYGKFDIMSKNLYSSEAITAQDLTALTFYKDGAKVFVSKASTSATDWVLTFPLERKVDYNDFSKFLSWVTSMRVSQYVEENAADLKVYGLDTPKYVFEYTLGGKNYVLKLGIQKDSKYYAQMEGNPAVFTLDASTLNFVDMPILDLIENFVYIPTIYDVEKLVINMDGRTDTLLINANKEDTTKDSYSINGKKVEGDDKQTLFKRYYQAAIAIAGDKIDLEAKPSGTAVISLTYTLKQANANGEKNMTVDLIPTPDGYGFYLMMNGKYTGMVMGNRQLDKEEMGLRQTYKNLMDALK